MNLRAIYQHAGSGKQAAILLLLTLFGTSLSASISLFILTPSLITQSVSYLQVNQLVAAICTFLLPALAASYLFSRYTKSYLSIRRTSIGSVLLVISSMLAILPAIQLLGVLNQQIVLPEIFKSFEAILQAQEALMESITKQFFASNTPIDFVINIFIIAVTASITEELFFRGSLQRILGQNFTNHHTIIWLSAFIFSSFHLQFYGLIPRMLLGAYFSYLLYWSHSIWLPIIAHFVNNAMGVWVISNPAICKDTILAEESNTAELWIPALIGSVLFTVCVLFIRKRDTSEV